jgi:hypothetical protein
MNLQTTTYSILHPTTTTNTVHVVRKHVHDTMRLLVTNRVLVTRVELDAALGKLKKQYEQESKEWQSKIAAQQETHNCDLSEVYNII